MNRLLYSSRRNITTLLASLLLTLLVQGKPLLAEEAAFKPQGLSETLQFEWVQRMIADGLAYSAQQAAEGYLQQWPKGVHQERVMFLKARSLELQPQKEQAAFDHYRAFQQKYPESPLNQEASLAIGALHYRMGQDDLALKALEEMKQRYPHSEYAGNAAFWIAKTLFSKADTARKIKAGLFKPEAEPEAPTEQTPGEPLQLPQAENLQIEDGDFTNTEKSKVPQEMTEAEIAETYLQSIRAFKSIPTENRLTPAQQHESLYLIAWAHQHRREYGEASDYFAQHIIQDDHPTRNPRSWLQLGFNTWKLGDLAQAEKFLVNLQQEFPNSALIPTSMFLIAEIHFQDYINEQDISARRERVDALVAEYEAYLATGELLYQDTAQFRIAEVHENANRRWPALQAYVNYSRGENPLLKREAQFRAGSLYDQVDRPRQAIRFLENAYRENLSDVDVRVVNKLAALYDKTNRVDDLKGLMNEVKNNQSIPEQQRVYFLVQAVEFQLDSERCDQVLEDLQAIPESANQAQRHYLLYARGTCFYQQKQYQAAREDLREIRHDPKYREVVFEPLNDIYQNLGNWFELAANIDAAIKRKSPPLQNYHYQYLVNSHAQLEDHEQLNQAYLAWEKTFPQNTATAEHQVQWGRALEALNKPDLAAQHYETALNLLKEPRVELRESLANRLFQLYTAAKAYEKAVRVYEKGLLEHVQEPNKRRQYSLLLGKTLYLQLKQIGKARYWLKQADGGGTSEVELEAAYLTGQLEEEAGRHKEALAVFQNLAKRSISSASWLIPIHFQTGRLAETVEDYPLARDHYSQAFTPQTSDSSLLEIQKNAKERYRALSDYLNESQLQTLVRQQKWQEVASALSQRHQQGSPPLQQNHYETWIQATTEAGDWRGLLQVWPRYNKAFPGKANTYEALLSQGYAADQLGQSEKAIGFYEQALLKLPSTETQNRIGIAERLGALYQQTGQHAKRAKVYQDIYPFLSTPAQKAQFALVLATLYKEQLKQPKAAVEWYLKADQGGSSDQDLNTLWTAAEIEQAAGNQAKATQYLSRAASRKIPANSQWSIVINYQLAITYHQQEDWNKALLHYTRVARASNPGDYAEYVQTSRQQAKSIQDYLNSQ